MLMTLLLGRVLYLHPLQVQEMREFLEPLLRVVVESVLPESVDDWAACFTDVSVSFGMHTHAHLL